MRHGMPEEDVINDRFDFGRARAELPLVATNDSHYLSRGDAQAHDVLLCIGTGKTVADTSRMKFFSDEFYVKSAEEMRELFADVPEACDNTLEIVKRIDLKIPEKIFYLPGLSGAEDAAADVAGVLAGAPASGAPTPRPIAGSRWAPDEYLRADLRARAGRALRCGACEERPGVARAARIRTRRHRQDGLHARTS